MCDNDPVIAGEVARFLQENRVAESVSAGRIIGCPHQEGIDYPIGRVCPRCPFWAGIDRFTHEPVTRPVPTMSPTDILAALSETRSTHPREALASADGHRDALIEPLLAELERGIANPTEASEEEGNLFGYALYLMAKWREPRAYSHVCRWLSLPGDEPFEIAGDVVTQDGGTILAAVCDGDLEPIKSLGTNPHANEHGRGAPPWWRSAAWPYGLRCRANPSSNSSLWLAREGLEREPSHVWDTLVSESVDIEAREVSRRFAVPMRTGSSTHGSSRGPNWRRPKAPFGDQLQQTRDRYPPIDDVADATAWWGCFEKARRLRTQRSSPKIGRNEPCPCGSGKKYKKCCGR